MRKFFSKLAPSKLAAALLALTIAGSLPAAAVSAADGGWQRDQAGWWYQNADGSYPAGDWAKIDGNWYHFSDAGYMQTGWLKDGGWYYLKSTGEMQTGWLSKDGRSYFLSSTGRMAQNMTVIIDGSSCSFDENGVLTAQLPIGGEVTAEGILAGINAYRMEKGLNPLSYAANLQAGADQRAKECAGEFAKERAAHTRPDGSLYATAYDWNGAVGLVENLAMQPDYLANDALVVQSWKNSADHNANMLHQGMTGGAVGVWRDPGSGMFYIAFAAERRTN